MKILFLSGGADSMLLNQLQKFDKIVFFNYGQEHLKKEFDCCSKYVTSIIKLPEFTKRNKETNCRNLSFIINAVAKYGYEDLEIYIGTNKEDIYKDNTRNFYNKVGVFISEISFNKVKIITPLIDMNKKEILELLECKYYTD
tara:strand:+ start:1104 stop:1529 length:426 start_codon:yes stop_codon:yes gene_type:complete